MGVDEKTAVKPVRPGEGALARFAGSPLAWVYLVVAAAATCCIGIQLGNRWVLPILNAAAAYPVFLGGVASGRRARTAGQMLVWAGAMSLAFAWLTANFPARVEAATLHGAAYRDEMLEWIRTGAGKESTPRLFLPEHALHFGIFCAAAFLSVGFAAMVFGAALLNYMNFYVGSLIARTDQDALAALVGWPPYAEIRVVGYIVTAIAITELSRRVLARRPLAPGWERTLGAGLWLVVLDVILKALLAPYWLDVLRLIRMG
jgi:hypothetical protein